MLTTQQMEVIKATVPVLQRHGVALISHFYQRMLSNQPELKNIFNQTHQATGHQQKALAMAVLAYAQNIENPSVLAGALRHIAVKHCTVGIRAEHYPIVGRHLLASIQEVLGEACTPDILDAWGAAYQQLADLLIQMEQRLYTAQTTQEGGWSGWRPFRVVGRRVLSQDVTEFSLEPSDGGKISKFTPGQFISIRSFIPSKGYQQPRQYTLSQAYDPEVNRLTIAIKKVTSEDLPDGVMSTHVHDTFAEGTIVDVSAPTGDFTIDTKEETPLVLMAAGIGITPIKAMVQALSFENPNRSVSIYLVRKNSSYFPYAEEIRRRVASMPNAHLAVFYTSPKERDHLGRDFDVQGRLDVSNMTVNPGAQYFVCGPEKFMLATRNALVAKGVHAQNVHVELFGTGSL